MKNIWNFPAKIGWIFFTKPNVITHFEQTVYEPLGRDFRRNFHYSRKYLSSNSVERLIPTDLLDLEPATPVRSRSPTPPRVQSAHFSFNQQQWQQIRIPPKNDKHKHHHQNVLAKKYHDLQSFSLTNNGGGTAFDPMNCQSSKRELISNAFKWMNENFGGDFDTMGRRGENVMRLKVKTLKALQHIITFLELCVAKNLIKGISAPLSTKGRGTRSRSSRARNRCRGFLAYIEAFSQDKVQEVVKIFDTYQEANWNPFTSLECGVL